MPRLFTFFCGTSTTVRSASAIHQLPFAVRADFPTCNNARASASGRLDTAPLLYAGSAYAVQWINSRREYPTKKGCAIMALTVEEVIRMLDDAYEDNSDDDLGIDIVEQENAFFSGEGN